MALEQKLHLKLAQKLVMTPTLQQAIKLLQLSRLELEQALAQEVQANPLLEMTDEAPGDEEAAGVEVTADVEEAQGAEEAVAEARGRRGRGTGRGAGRRTDGTRGAGASRDRNRRPLRRGRARRPLRELPARRSERRAGVGRRRGALAGELAGPRGRACSTTSAHSSAWFRSRTGLSPRASSSSATSTPTGTCGHRTQSLPPSSVCRSSRSARRSPSCSGSSPPGSAARSLKECFLLQLERFDREIEPEMLALTKRVVGEAFEDVLHQRWDRIAQKLSVARESIRAVMEVLRHLDPHPGARLGPNDNQAIEPDVVVAKDGDQWRVVLNDDGLPRLRCLAALPAAAAEPHARGRGEGLPARADALGAVVPALGRAAPEHDRDASPRRSCAARRISSSRGIPHLRPLVLRDIADDIGMHESTVSRVVANKYMATPRGIFPLKFFFHSAISHARPGRHLLGGRQGTDQGTHRPGGAAPPALRRPSGAAAQPPGHPHRPPNRGEVP